MLDHEWQGNNSIHLFSFEISINVFFCLSFSFKKRIRTELEGGAWCPERPIGPKSYEYIEIELHHLYYINAIETQGRFDNGQGNEFAEFYRVQYQRENNISNWLNYSNKKTNKTVKFFNKKKKLLKFKLNKKNFLIVFSR